MSAFLSLQGVSRRCSGLVAVDAVSAAVAAGELLSVIGPNGAGKTTLFNLLTGQLSPSAGRMTFNGAEINRQPPEERARLGFGRTFQISPTLTPLTTLENTMIGSFLHHRGVADAADRAYASLELVGLQQRADVLASKLTLSERRRLEVARALALDPKVVLLDEVMAGLNQTEVQGMVDLVRTLNARGLTFLVIEHNLKVVRQFSHRVVVLHRGAKLAEGSAAQVLADPAVVEAYIGKSKQ